MRTGVRGSNQGQRTAQDVGHRGWVSLLVPFRRYFAELDRGRAEPEDAGAALHFRGRGLHQAEVALRVRRFVAQRLPADGAAASERHVGEPAHVAGVHAGSIGLDQPNVQPR